MNFQKLIKINYMTAEQENVSEMIINWYKVNKGKTLHRDQVINQFNKGVHTLDDIRTSIVNLLDMELLRANDGRMHTQDSYFLTEAGWKFTTFEKHKNKIAEKEQFEERKEKVDLLQKEFIYKKRYWPFYISGGALAVSLISLCIAFLNYKKAPQEKVKEIQPIQQVTTPKVELQTKPLLQKDTSKKSSR